MNWKHRKRLLEDDNKLETPQEISEDIIELELPHEEVAGDLRITTGAPGRHQCNRRDPRGPGSN